MRDNSEKNKCFIFNELDAAYGGDVISYNNLLGCINAILKYFKFSKCCNNEYFMTIYESKSFHINNNNYETKFKKDNQISIDTYLQMLNKFINQCGIKKDNFRLSDPSMNKNCPGLNYIIQNILIKSDDDKFIRDFTMFLKSSNFTSEYKPVIKKIDRLDKNQILDLNESIELKSKKDNISSLITESSNKELISSNLESALSAYLQKNETQFTIFLNKIIKSILNQDDEKNLTTTTILNDNMNKNVINKFHNIIDIGSKNTTKEEVENSFIGSSLPNENNTQENEIIPNINKDLHKIIIKINNKILDNNFNMVNSIYEQINNNIIFENKVFEIRSIKDCCHKNKSFNFTLCLGQPLNLTKNNSNIYNKNPNNINLHKFMFKNTEKSDICDEKHSLSDFNGEKINLFKHDVNNFDIFKLEEFKKLEEKCNLVYNSKKMSDNYLDAHNICIFPDKNLLIEEKTNNQNSLFSVIFFIFIGILISFVFLGSYKLIKCFFKKKNKTENENNEEAEMKLYNNEFIFLNF